MRFRRSLPGGVSEQILRFVPAEVGEHDLRERPVIGVKETVNLSPQLLLGSHRFSVRQRPLDFAFAKPDRRALAEFGVRSARMPAIHRTCDPARVSQPPGACPRRD